jgi:hypothetical protein
VPFIRSIGKWTLTALVINAIIASGIFGLPSELARLLGRNKSISYVACGIAKATMILCMAEVASQFSEAGASAEPKRFQERASRSMAVSMSKRSSGARKPAAIVGEPVSLRTSPVRAINPRGPLPRMHFLFEMT